jgi:N-acetyl sugar amidotransferase
MITRCTRCLMPTSRPGSIFNSEGVCQACLNHDKRKTVDWDARLGELKALLKERKNEAGHYDCAIAVSGGKDSYFLVDLFKNKLGMKPLLIRVADGFGMSKAGYQNLRNMPKVFDCEMIELTPPLGLYQKLVRTCFEDLGNFPFCDQMIYVWAYNEAIRHECPVIVFGENPAFTYGTSDKDSPEAVGMIATMQSQFIRFCMNYHISLDDIYFMMPPIHGMNTQPIFTSYYVPWSGSTNYEVAKTFGFQDLEFQRQSNIEDFDQIDALGWQISNFLKFRKFGFGRVTDIASRWIREGKITREQGMDYVVAQDSLLDWRILDDFLASAGYTKEEFWTVIEKWSK